METFTGNETTIIRPLAEAESQVTSRCNRDLAPPNKRRWAQLFTSATYKTAMPVSERAPMAWQRDAGQR